MASWPGLTSFSNNENYLCFYIQNILLNLIKILTCAQFSGADGYKLFCGPMFVPVLTSTLLDPGGRFRQFHVSLPIIVLCISQFHGLPSPGQAPGKKFKNCQIPAPKANFLVKSQGAGLPWNPLF